MKRFFLLQFIFLIFSTLLLGNPMTNNSIKQEKKIARYGTWDSPVSAEKIAAGSNVKQSLLIDEGNTYYSEIRPENKGRSTVVKRDPEGTCQDATPPDFNVRTFVHEYGGGAFTVHKGVIYASSGADSALYVIRPGKMPVKLTKGQKKIGDAGQTRGTRFADLHVTSKGLIAVGEHHEPGQTVENFLALIDLKTGKMKKIAEGYDFYSSPAISPDEKKIAWICWNHPNMPWTNSELWLADLDEEGFLINQRRIAGEIPESIFQPQWSPDGVLYFTTDRSEGWWNIHRYNSNNGTIENVLPLSAEVGEPLWIFDRSVYAFLNPEKIVFTFNSEGIWRLGLLDLVHKRWRLLGNTGNSIVQLRSGKGYVQFLESYADRGEALIQIDDQPNYPMRILQATEPMVDQECISPGQHIAFPSEGRTAYAFYYPPKSQDFQGPKEELPPLVVMVHGGPIAQTRGAFQLKHQYWTTRGFAVLDVNYGGSSGYGRAYRSLLNRNWGIVDVEDCMNGAKFLAEKGLVDPNKLVIRGGSAGGFTTLAALTKGNTFKAGGNYYGVADITALAKDTHKFEKYDMEQLVGKYPEEKEIWTSRSPLHSVDKITSPLIIFQGEDDRIVPKNQSVMIYEALKAKGIPTEIHLYPGEEHGLRQAANLIHSLKRESDFYLEVFGLKPRLQPQMQENK